jgi:hypothetical protein
MEISCTLLDGSERRGVPISHHQKLSALWMWEVDWINPLGVSQLELEFHLKDSFLCFLVRLRGFAVLLPLSFEVWS